MTTQSSGLRRVKPQTPVWLLLFQQWRDTNGKHFCVSVNELKKWGALLGQLGCRWAWLMRFPVQEPAATDEEF